ETPGQNSRDESEKPLAEGLAKGRLNFVLHGEKLKSEFALVKLKRGEENAWLLMKKHDEFASTDNVTDDDQSVLTGRTLADVAAGKTRPAKRQLKKKSSSPAHKRAPQHTLPRYVKPMLATLVDEP